MGGQDAIIPFPSLPMDTTTHNMLILLRISLSGKKPEIPLFTYKEWEDIYWLARKHGVVTMINDAIEMLPPDLQPQGDIALSWTLSAERTRYHFNHQAEVLGLIDRKAQAEGLPYVLLKGMSLARLYPRPDSRACGDIDICFPHNYEKGNILLGNPNAKVDGKHAEMAIDGVNVENHLRLLDLHFKSQKRAERYVWAAMDPVPEDHCLPPMANMVYLLMHTVCHLTAKFKLPLRNILDWGIFLRANQDTLNPQECHRVMQHIGMVDAFNLLTHLAGEFIDTDLSPFIIGKIRQNDVDRMRELILTKQYLDPVPKGLPLPKRIVARAQRHSQRSWLYRYLPSTRFERLWGHIVQQFKPTINPEE